MKVVLCVAVLLLVVLPSFEATPTSQEEGVVKRALRAFGVQPARSRVRRQAMCEEGNNTYCLMGTGFVNVSTELVQCIASQCVCNDCFMEDSETGRCRTCPDYVYSETLRVCGRDDRQSQLTAFLLSFFLSSTGAANFYINQNSLAGGQLFLLVLLLVSSYIMCYLPCCMACCLAKEEVKGSVVFIVLMIILVLLVVLASLAIWGWWIADIVIFATNQRLSGNGCTLQDTL